MLGKHVESLPTHVVLSKRHGPLDEWLARGPHAMEPHSLATPGILGRLHLQESRKHIQSPNAAQNAALVVISFLLTMRSIPTHILLSESLAKPGREFHKLFDAARDAILLTRIQVFGPELSNALIKAAFNQRVVCVHAVLELQPIQLTHDCRSLLQGQLIQAWNAWRPRHCLP